MFTRSLPVYPPHSYKYYHHYLTTTTISRAITIITTTITTISSAISTIIWLNLIPFHSLIFTHSCTHADRKHTWTHINNNNINTHTQPHTHTHTQTHTRAHILTLTFMLMQIESIMSDNCLQIYRLHDLIYLNSDNHYCHKVF